MKRHEKTYPLLIGTVFHHIGWKVKGVVPVVRLGSQALAMAGLGS